MSTYTAQHRHATKAEEHFQSHADPIIVAIGRLLYQARMDELKRSKARTTKKSYRKSRRDHRKVTPARW
jgi:hypothetical protein